MKPPRLLHFLYRLFTILFYGQGALLLLLLIVMPIALTWQSRPADNSLAARKSRVRYDTIFSKRDFSTTDFTPAVLDNQGNFISKIQRQQAYLTYFDDLENPIARLRIDSLQRLYRPTNAASLPSAMRQRVLTEQQKQTWQIDSVLRDNPTAMIYRMPDRWLLQPGDYGNGFVWRINVPLQMIFQSKNKPYRRPVEWHELVSYQPYSDLRTDRSSQEAYKLEITIRRWADLTPAVWPLFALSLFWGMLYLVGFMLVSHWFRQLFADLTQGNYFQQRVANRLRGIGWLFIGLFVLKNLFNAIQPLVAYAYIRQQGYIVVTAWVFDGFDHWPWLGAGLILLAFVPIFRYGTQLQHEQDLTV